ncbi:unnamed protein product [Diamesa serratosioi]
MVNSKVHFKVKWENYSVEDSTWEPIDNLKNCIVLKNFIDDVCKDLQSEIINTNRKLFHGKLNIENKIFHNLECPTEDLELKGLQIIYNLMIQKGFNPSENFTLFYMEEFRLSRLRMHLDRLTIKFRSLEDKFLIHVENNVDYDVPPPFQYITKHIISSDLDIKKKTQYGCYCHTNCSSSQCCPRALLHFKDETKRKALKDSQIIYECSDQCSCNLSCSNRKTQQRSSISLSLFKTRNNRGWGVKTKTSIQSNTYIFEYLGKVMDQTEANQKRGTYMFDLYRPENSNNFYTIDARKYGNLSRFLNHSCNPNCTIWTVLQCNTNYKLFKLCFFSKRYIPPNEELTIDYAVNQIEKSAKTSEKCNCGSSKCKGYIF